MTFEQRKFKVTEMLLAAAGRVYVTNDYYALDAELSRLETHINQQWDIVLAEVKELEDLDND